MHFHTFCISSDRSFPELAKNHRRHEPGLRHSLGPNNAQSYLTASRTSVLVVWSEFA
jgi:hypothetical protein